VSVLFYEIRRKYGLYSLFKASIRGFLGRREFERTLHTHRAVVIQRYARGWLARVRYRRVIRGIVKLQSHFRRRQAKKELKKLKVSTVNYSLQDDFEPPLLGLFMTSVIQEHLNIL